MVQQIIKDTPRNQSWRAVMDQKDVSYFAKKPQELNPAAHAMNEWNSQILFFVLGSG